MKIHWNSCFLCLFDLNLVLPSTSGGARGRKRKCDPPPNVTILMKYLLQTDTKKYDKLLQRILEASRYTQDCPEEIASPQSSAFPIHFCDKCISYIKRVSELHMQLEALQMQLVHNLKFVRARITGNSKVHGSNEAAKASLQMFEDFLVALENQGGHNESLQLDRNRLDLLYSFQDAIFERGLDMPPQIPFVFLESISHFKPHPTSPGADAYYRQECVAGLDSSFIKTEQAGLHFLEYEFGESYNYSPPPVFSDNLVHIDTSVPVLRKRITPQRSTRKLRCTSTVSRKIEVKVSNRPKPKSIDDTTAKVRRSRQKRVTVARKKAQRRKGSLAKRNNPLESGNREKGFSYRCESCPFIAFRGCKFEHHLRGHETTDKIHTCSICEQKFSGKQLFEYHMNLHTGGTSIVACDFDGCSSRLPRAELPDHIRKSHGGKVFLCQCCSFSSATREKYMRHVKFHGNLNLICDVCSKKFRKRENLYTHLFEDHGVVKKLKCDVEGCEETCLDPFLLIVHKKTHRNVTIYVCKECNQSFTCKNSHNVHMEIHSKRERSVNCDLCTEMFISRYALEQHKLKSHNAPKLICKYCQQEFPDYRKLLKHITKNHEGARYPCTNCARTFLTPASWVRHQNAHAVIRGPIVCEECGKTFQTKVAWKTHAKTHSEKMHKCSYCPKSFTMNRYLKEHIRIHTGERPWICDNCGKAFSQQGSMQLHKRKVHNLKKDTNEKGEKIKSGDLIW